MEVNELPIWWSVLLIGVSSLVIKLLNKLWFEPRRIRTVLSKQGIRGPRPTFPFGNVPEMQKIQSTMINNTHEEMDGQHLNHKWLPSVFPYIHKWAKEYGPIYMYSTGINQHLYVSDPKLLMEIKQHNSLDLGKPTYLGKPLRPLLGDGLLRTNGKQWAVQRKLLAPEFFLGKVKGMVGVMEESTTAMIKRWDCRILESKSGIVDMEIDDELKTLSADIISRACFGSSYSFGNQIFEKIADMVEVYGKPSLQFGFLNFSWFLPNKKVWNLRKEVDSMLLKLVTDRQVERQSGGATENDLLQMLLDIASTNTDIPARRRETFVLDNCRNIYFASSATTSLTESWTLMLLSLHPEWQDRIRAEIIEVCGVLNKLHHSLHDMDMLRKFKVLTMVIQESMRLYPSGVLIARAILANVKLGDLDVPKGTNIHVCSAALHCDPENWGPDADEFKPERFANGISNACKHPQAYVPFGFGTRVCIGQTFAMTQLKIVLSLILSKFSFSLSPNYRHSPVHKMILMPKHGIRLLVEPVQTS
ncbi:putative cytochrome P450 [Rosa chinensis]|uniref:Putative cytochrome P450 n=1 Tax=Rosa chinensis TaxID=74649 RepID=A0A2P6R870_ROSCH|nr:cytochrome P450 714A1 [Rosa chinensis]PRQ42630.1 putative cytochrome P450 [Rosa chinensis]